MDDHQIERISPKRLRLVGIFLGSALIAAVECGLAFGIVADLLHRQAQSPFAIIYDCFLFALCIVVTPYMVLFALWALVRQFLPALILTPTALINHSIVYRVVMPWAEIDQFVFFLHRDTGQPLSYFLVLTKNDSRLLAIQQPLTRLLLRLFRVLIPTNIETKVMADTQEDVWTKLHAYVHRTVADQHIKFTTHY